MRSQIYKDLTISLPSFPSTHPLVTAQFFFAPPPPLLSNPSMCVTCLGLFTRYFYFSRWLFFLVYRALSLSLPLYSSLYPPPLFLSLLCRVISGNGAAAMFCLPGAGLLQAWRVPCLRSGFRDYPPPTLLPASLLFSSEATCNFSPNTYIQTPFRSCHGWGT